MSTYRTGNHHGVTIVREGDERICALLNADDDWRARANAWRTGRIEDLPEGA